MPEEEGTLKRANILMDELGKGTGGCLEQEGEEMLQSPISLAGVFFSSVQCIAVFKILIICSFCQLHFPYKL